MGWDGIITAGAATTSTDPKNPGNQTGANTGGGGGGANNSTPGAGGSGIVIIRYQ